MNLLGPKTEADLAPPPSNKVDKKPKAAKDPKSAAKEGTPKDEKSGGKPWHVCCNSFLKLAIPCVTCCFFQYPLVQLLWLNYY